MEEENKRKLLKLNLQHFAEPNPEGGEPGELTDPPTDPKEPKGDDDPPKDAYTQKEVDSQISKAVDSALKKREAKLQDEVNKRIEKERAEAAEYAKLTQKEKEQADYQKKVKDIEKREQELNNRELYGQIETDLKENNLPVSFAKSLLTIQDNEKIKESITDIKKEFDEAVNSQVKEKLRQDTPPTGAGAKKDKTPTIGELAKENRIIK